MALTTTQIDAIIETLTQRLGNPAGRERFADREVAWSTADELVQRITYFESLRASTASEDRPRQIRMITGSGY